MERTLTLGSMFDGSSGFPLGGLLAGIKPVWASEIEPFPIRVTTKRLPQMKHYGDISQMNGGEIEPVDIITFGSPCTDMSIAGKRAGLDGRQSSLFYQAVRIIREMREATNGRYPRYCVWENVVGAFSSNGGQDFKAVLEAVIGIVEPGTEVPAPEKNRWPYADCYVGDGWSVAYRTFDAQHWGVPQRRKRIYLVGDFGGECAGKILFESEGLSGYSAEGFRAWQRAAGSAAAGSGETGTVCLNDQGGQRMDVTEDVAATLRAQEHGHPPCVLAAGFCKECSAQSRGIGYEEERAPTLRAGVIPTAVALENHPTDSRVRLSEDGKVQTLTSRMGTGGGNVPLLLKIRSGCEGGGKGPIIQEDISATLSCNNDQTLFMPKAYGVCSKESNAMKSDNPHSGFYEADTARTIDTSGTNPSSNQGGIMVLDCGGSQPSHHGVAYKNEVYCIDQGGGKSSCCFYENQSPTLTCTHGGEPVVSYGTAVVSSYAIQGSMIGRAEKNGPQGDGINEDVSFTLNTVDRHAVYAMTPGKYTQVEMERTPTLTARDFKDPTLIKSGYSVRRLTPTECAKLQGFPPWWCYGLETPEPTEADIAFWSEVWETHRKIAGSSTKSKSRNQIIKWLKNPHSDSAEYKMWGNGVALPNVFFVLAGIVWSTQNESE